jgi:hypothetical protein
MLFLTILLPDVLVLVRHHVLIEEVLVGAFVPIPTHCDTDLQWCLGDVVCHSGTLWTSHKRDVSMDDFNTA